MKVSPLKVSFLVALSIIAVGLSLFHHQLGARIPGSQGKNSLVDIEVDVEPSESLVQSESQSESDSLFAFQKGVSKNASSLKSNGLKDKVEFKNVGPEYSPSKTQSATRSLQEMDDETLAAILLMLFILWIICCCCNPMDLLACFCCFEICCDDGTGYGLC